MNISHNHFSEVDIRCGKIISASENIKAKKPSYILKIEFGENIGLKTSSAQITKNYTKESLIGKKIVAVVNFPPKNIAGIVSEVLVLATVHNEEVFLIETHPDAKIGSRVF